MSSFAAWLGMKTSEGALEERRPCAELHFNFWYAYGSSPDRENNVPVLDVGILIDDFEHIDKLSLYFPFNVSRKEIEDLGVRLNNDTTLNAVFNDNHRIQRTSGGKAFLVTRESRELNGEPDKKFIVYMLDVEKNLHMTAQPYSADESGTTISIPVSDLHDLNKESVAANCRNCYFRFRIISENLKNVLVHDRTHTRTDAFFHDALSLTRVIEFRLNHSRSLPLSLREDVSASGGFMPLSQLHFFLLTDETVELLNDQSATIRRLEKNVWDGYLPNIPSQKGDFSNVIAYHWKKIRKQDKDSLYDWDLYAKVRLLFRNKLTLLLYVSAIILFGALGSAMVEVIKRVFFYFAL